MRLGVLADLHWSDDPHETETWHNPYQFDGLANRIASALEWFSERTVDALAILGDISHRGDEVSLRAAIAGLRGFRSPVLVVAGNHDLWQQRGGPLKYDDFERALVSSRAEGARLASAEGECRHGIRIAGLQLASPDLRVAGPRLQGLPPVAAWAAEPVIVLSHYPVLSRAALLASRRWAYAGDLVDQPEVEAALRRRTAPTVVLSGHIHARDVHSDGALLQLSQAAAIEPPFDAGIVDITITDGHLRVQRDTLRLPGEPAIREPSLARERGAWQFDGARWHANGLETI